MIVTSFMGICLLVFLGKFLRLKIRLLQRLYLPSSVIAGLLGLLAVQMLQPVAGDFVVAGLPAGTPCPASSSTSCSPPCSWVWPFRG